MHTFIGSYEIQYTFWLFASLIFGLNALPPSSIPAEAPFHKDFSHRKMMIFAALLFLAYGVIHVWNSTHTLSLSARTEQLGLKQEFGLDKPEKTADGREFRWTKRYGGFPLKIEGPDMIIPIHAAHPNIKTKPVVVRFFLVEDLFKQKRFVSRITLTSNAWQEVRLPVSREIGQNVILLIKISRTWNPLKSTGVPDPRNLGLAIGPPRFESGNKLPPSAAARAR